MKPWIKKTIFVATGLAALAVVAFVLLRSGPLAPVKVTVVQVAEGRIRPDIFGVGSVEAQRSWMVGPTTAGRVREVTVEVGDTVKAGQLLAEMDPVDLEQRLLALDATVARANSAQAAAQAQLQDAAARRELAGLNAIRNQELARQNFISAGALEGRLQEKSSADAAYQAALANVNVAAQDSARVKAEKAALSQQRANVRLLAPADAVVVSRDAEAGSTVVAGQPVVRLADPASLWVRMRIDQGRSAGLASGLPAQIVLRSKPQSPLAGRVARVDWQADSVTEERIAHIAFATGPDGAPNTTPVAALGELAEVTLTLPETAPALLLPNASVQRLPQQVGVWRLRAGRPEFVAVRLGSSSLDGQVQVLHGLSAGDTVVVYSQKALSADSRIEVVDRLVPGAVKGVGADAATGQRP